MGTSKLVDDRAVPDFEPRRNHFEQVALLQKVSFCSLLYDFHYFSLIFVSMKFLDAIIFTYVNSGDLLTRN